MSSTISYTSSMEAPFFDVDSLHVVWHGHYVKYMEIARCNLLDHIGFNYQDMREQGFMFPVIKMDLKYISPIVFGQQFEIVASLEEWQCQLKIAYLFRDPETHKKICTAQTVQAAVEKASGEMHYVCPQGLQDQVQAYLDRDHI